MEINAWNTLAVAGGIGGVITVLGVGLRLPLIGPLQILAYVGGGLGVIGLIWLLYDKFIK